MRKDDAAFRLADILESERKFELGWIEDHDNPARITLDRIIKLAIFGVCGWSLIETPLEMGVSNSDTWLLALAVSKLIVISTGIGAITRVRGARAIFAFICAVSVLAIAPALPLVYIRSAEIALISTVECVLKAACLGALCLSSLRKKPRKRRASTVHVGMQQDRPSSDDVI